MPQAIGLFAGTNIDDIVVLALLLGQARDREGVRRVVLGQYLGFAAILAVAVAGSLGATLLPEDVLRWLGLVPLAMGLHGGREAWRAHRMRPADPTTPGPGLGVVPLPDAARAVEAVHSVAVHDGPSIVGVAAIVASNGGDDLGVYIPAFAAAGPWALWVYVPVFLVMVGVWCAAGRFVATRPVIASSISRRRHILVPVVLVAIGLIILLS